MTRDISCKYCGQPMLLEGSSDDGMYNRYYYLCPACGATYYCIKYDGVVIKNEWLQ